MSIPSSNRAAEFFFPELRFLVDTTDSVLHEALGEVLGKRLFSRPLGTLPFVTVQIRGSLSDNQPISPISHRSYGLEHGYRYWLPRGRGRPVGSRAVPESRCLGNGYASARIEEKAGKLRVDLQVHPGFRRLESFSLEDTIDTVLRVIFHRFGFFPVSGAVARGVGPVSDCPTSAESVDREESLKQVLLLGNRAPLEATLALLDRHGWSVSDRSLLCLKRDEPGVFVHGGGEDVPVVFPRRVIFFDLTRGGSSAGSDARAGAFRNLFHYLTRSRATPDCALDVDARREERALLGALASQVRRSKIRWSEGDPSAAAQRALTALGLREARGWDVDGARSVRRGPVAVPRRFSYFTRL